MKSAKGNKPRIVVKVIRGNDDSMASGVWKIAYADFVTAMMAFFLLMWLISNTSENDLKQIAEYFSTPLAVALMGGKTDDTTSTVIRQQGADTDIRKSRGHVAKKELDLQSAEMILKKQETDRLEKLKSRLEAAIDSDPSMLRFKKQLLIDITTRGLRIQIVDQQNRPMFDLGSTVLQPYADQILREIGRTLNEVPYKISLSGHTDARPYQGSAKNYNNWDLSIDRANASRRALISGGMDPDKVLRVIGLASAVPLDRKDPLDPINRRISIIVMNTEATEHAVSESK